ncbi:MAG: AIR carboxylase family protein, partial [Candidatus Aminicenantales bacterium]
MKVVIFLGSESDAGTMEDALKVLKDFGVPFGIEVTSAHRSPERTLRLVKSSEDAGAEVFIAVA